jgi:D-Tyr-tRNAtyr deacylase
MQSVSKVMLDLGVYLCRLHGDCHLVYLVGAFGEYMQVKLENDGPVTIILDSDE